MRRLWIFALVLGVAPATARAQVAPARVVPGPSGLVGTWRVLGRDAAADGATVAFEHGGAFCEEAGACGAPELLASPAADGAVSLGDGTVVALGARLEVTRAARASLFVAAGGELRVRVDGREVATRTATQRRDDDVRVALDLAPGRHTLVLRVARGGLAVDARWEASARVLDAALAPGTGDGVAVVAGALDAATRDAAIAQAARITETRDVDDRGGTHVRARVDWPAGALAGDVALRGVVPTSTTIAAPLASAHADADLTEPPSGDGPISTVQVGARAEPVGAHLAQDRPVVQAILTLRGLLPQASDASRAPLGWRLEELERVLASLDGDAAWRRTLADDARALSRRMARGEDPFAHLRGYVRMALRSRLDRRLVPYELFVPPLPPRGAPLPLLVTLHGFTGNAGDYFRDTFGLPRPPRQSLLEHGRDGPAPTTAPMIVVAPTGRAQTHYRYAGEEDVMEVLADVRARLPVDDARLYITGGSMGGTGAAYVPFHHPDLFAASAALAGYHDQRVRQDTNHGALAPWERFLEAQRSDVDWAENALHLPMLLIRGTHDLPTQWTSSLVDKLTELHYAVEHREPDSGHNVWNEAYADFGVFRWMAPHRRPADPAHVVFVTGDDRHDASFWVSGVRRDVPDAFARVDATRARDGSVTVRTAHVAALRVAPAAPGTAFTLRVDDDVLAATSPAVVARGSDGHFALADDAALARRPPLVRGIRDVYNEPIVVVVGDRATVLEREAARFWARPVGWDVGYPIVAEHELTDAMRQGHALVVVGTPATNGLLARAAARLPVQVDASGVRLGAQRFGGDEVGAAFVAADPDAPERTWLVVAAPSPLGVWRSTFLPELLPDHVVFDAGIAPARGRFAAGGTGATTLDAGFWPE